MKTVIPYSHSEASKKQQVAQMFDRVASRYDFLNHLLSLNIDRYWRRVAIAQLREIAPQHILDVATGTGDLALAALQLTPPPKQITGVDISEKMLELGREKIAKKGLSTTISLQTGDAENLPFDDECFDAVTVAFGVRNFENLEKGLSELHRVLRKGGKLVVLEFSHPQTFPVKQFYGIYSRYLLPFIGKWVSDDQSAYKYLPASVEAFPSGKAFADVLSSQKFNKIQWKPLTFGICSVYTGIK